MFHSLRHVVSYRRFCTLALFVTLLLVSLALTASPAAAGSYSAPHFDGGYWTFDDVPGNFPFPQANPYAGDHEDANFCGGDLTATSTWTPDNSADTSPAPQVIVTQTIDSYWDVRGVNGYPTASCADGFGDNEVDTTYMDGYYSGDSGRTNYSLKSPSGNTVTVTCSGVSATMDYNSTTPPVDDGDVGTSWGVTLSPVTITLSGTLKDNNGNPVLDSSGNQQILVGQGCGARLSGIPVALLNNTANPPTYKWSVSGTTFQNWTQATQGDQYASPPVPANSQASFYDPGPGVQTNPTYHWFWNDFAQMSETVTCTATVTPPAGQGSSFSVTATQNVTVYVPTLSMNTNTIGDGRIIQSAIIATPTSDMRKDLQNFGSSWTTAISMPPTPQFGIGQWCYCQLITPGEYVTSSGAQLETTETKAGDGLDATFPYQNSAQDSGIEPADGNVYHSGDSPRLTDLNSAVDSVQLKDTLHTYVMFQPPGSDVRWVPLSETHWSTDFSASIPPGGWSTFSPDISVGAVNLDYTFVRENKFPMWTQVVQSGQITFVPAN